MMFVKDLVCLFILCWAAPPTSLTFYIHLSHLKIKGSTEITCHTLVCHLETMFYTHSMLDHLPLQVVYRQAWNGMTTVLETNKTSMELQIPAGENYLVEIKALTEGGDGSSSGPIRIPKMSSKFPILCSIQMIGAGIMQKVGRMHCVTNPVCDWYCLSTFL